MWEKSLHNRVRTVFSIISITAMRSGTVFTYSDVLYPSTVLNWVVMYSTVLHIPECIDLQNLCTLRVCLLYCTLLYSISIVLYSTESRLYTLYRPLALLSALLYSALCHSALWLLYRPRRRLLHQMPRALSCEKDCGYLSSLHLIELQNDVFKGKRPVQ